MRITGGSFRSRALRAPRGDRTRPTSDRVREALFSILTSRRDGPSLVGARVLDLYAGTGALAIEALSRGAAHATVVENGAEALAALRANVQGLGLEARVRIVTTPVERAAPRADRAPEAPFDVVFADPPYALVRSGDVVRAMARWLEPRVLTSSATVVVEHASADAPPAFEALNLVDSRRYGDTTLSFYETKVVVDEGVCV